MLAILTINGRERLIGRAPKGGVEYNGKVYRGGQFCPLAAAIPPVRGGAPARREVYAVSRGNQYDRDGYRVERGALRGFGRIARRMDGTVGLTTGGDLHDLPAEVEAAVLATLADGRDREVVVGEDPAPEAVAAEWRSPRGLTLAEEMDREDSAY